MWMVKLTTDRGNTGNNLKVVEKNAYCQPDIYATIITNKKAKSNTLIIYDWYKRKVDSFCNVKDRITKTWKSSDFTEEEIQVSR